MNKRILSVLLVCLLTLSALPALAQSQEPVKIQFWQYSYDTKVALMDELIKEYTQEN